MANNKLTALKVESLTEAGRYADGGGLYFDIPTYGEMRWLYRYQLNGSRTWMTLFPYHKKTGSLAQARNAAMEQKLLVKQGIDPVENRQRQKDELIREKEEREIKAQEKSITFKFCAERYIDNKSAEWKNAKHKQQWENTLKTYVYPSIGSMPIKEIKTSDVRRCLDKIWSSKTETASRVRQRIEAVISSAIALGERQDGNPAVWKGLLENFYAKPEKIKRKRHIEAGMDGHFSAMPYKDVPQFMAELIKLDGIAPLALRFLILTAPRTTELRLALPEEIDLENKIWTIPEGRMKASKRHRVALSDAAIELYQSLPEIAGNEYIFSGWKKGKPLSEGGLLNVLRKRMNIDNYTVHGFRSSFRDYIGEETSFPERLAEFALAHQLTDEAERAYARGDKLKKRFDMMNAWAKYCDSKIDGANIVALNRQA